MPLTQTISRSIKSVHSKEKINSESSCFFPIQRDIRNAIIYEYLYLFSINTNKLTIR